MVVGRGGATEVAMRCWCTWCCIGCCLIGCCCGCGAMPRTGVCGARGVTTPVCFAVREATCAWLPRRLSLSATSCHSHTAAIKTQAETGKGWEGGGGVKREGRRYKFVTVIVCVCVCVCRCVRVCVIRQTKQKKKKGGGKGGRDGENWQVLVRCCRKQTLRRAWFAGEGSVFSNAAASLNCCWYNSI